MSGKGRQKDSRTLQVARKTLKGRPKDEKTLCKFYVIICGWSAHPHLGQGSFLVPSDVSAAPVAVQPPFKRPGCAAARRSWCWSCEIGGKARQRKARRSREPGSMIILCSSGSGLASWGGIATSLYYGGRCIVQVPTTKVAAAAAPPCQ